MKYISKKRIIISAATISLVPAPMPGAVIGSFRSSFPSLQTAATGRVAGGDWAGGTGMGADSSRHSAALHLGRTKEQMWRIRCLWAHGAWRGSYFQDVPGSRGDR